MTRAPRPSRSILFAVIVTALLAFPAGIVLASDSFGDVPNSNPFHADINALVDAGVTAGCGNNNYCPKANVTREQMAAFMNRLGALAPGKTPVVNAATAVNAANAANADTLDGLHASALGRVASASTNVPSAELTPVPIHWMEVEIEAPAAGWVHVTGAVTVREQACTMACTAAARLHSWPMGDVSFGVEEWIDERGTLALTQVFFVEEGTNWFELWVERPVKEDGAMNGWVGQISAIYVPFDGAGDPAPAP